MINFWTKLNKPIIALAPMAGITDQPFRIMCKKFGADVVFSEMISSEAIYHKKISNNKLQITNKFQNPKSEILNSSNTEKLNIGNYLGFVGQSANCNLDFSLLKTLNLIRFSKVEQPFVVQIFGSDPQKMAFSAKYISSGEWFVDLQKITNNKPQISNSKIQKTNKFQTIKSNVSKILDIDKFKFGNYLGFDVCNLEIMSIPSGIDINMGCPAKDVVKQNAGSALMKDYKLASQIIKSVKKSTNLPVSVKTRLGWNDPNEILEFSKVIQEAGADLLTVHGRTYKQGFAGLADWETIYRVKKQLKIPVLLNGGINSVDDYKKIDINKVDGVMVGRGVLGKPWIFKEIKSCPPPARWPTCPAKPWQSGKASSKVKEVAGKFDFQLLKTIILEHANLVNKLKGPLGIIEMRKHLAWYFKGIPEGKDIKEQLIRVNTLNEIIEILG